VAGPWSSTVKPRASAAADGSACELTGFCIAAAAARARAVDCCSA
jgi:hypothetical protein